MTSVRVLVSCIAMAAALEGCSDSTGEASSALTATAVAATDHQSALVGAALPKPLEVLVQVGGHPKAGALVSWAPTTGSLAITSGQTDTNGIASARWTLGTASGEHAAYATVDRAEGAPVQFTATALGHVYATIDPRSNHQAARVSEELVRQLAVDAIVDGVPAKGIEVGWATADGDFTYADDHTDASGRATAIWRMGSITGSVTAHATVERMQGEPLAFVATALPGPPASLEKVEGDHQVVPANLPGFSPLRVVAFDRFGNDALWAIVWSVESGPVTLLPSAGGENDPVRRVVGTGIEGEAVVRATVLGTAFFVGFNLTASPPLVPLVVLDESYRFVSAQNGSIPAADTVAVGTTVTWLLRFVGYDDYGVVSDGEPSFIGDYFPYEAPSTIAVTFTAPGTYRYTDLYGGVTGTVVVE